MRCRKVRYSLSTYFRGELPADKAAEVKQHISECASCRREAEAVSSVINLVRKAPSLKTSSDFNARLMERITSEGKAPAKSRAYLPRPIPRFNRMRLATITATAVVVFALALGVNFGDSLVGPSTSMTSGINGGDDVYMTIQPVNNPLLDERKSLADVVKRYNRWREYSRSLRTSTVEQIIGGAGNAIMTSGRSATPVSAGYRVRPVVRNYMMVPLNQTNSSGSETY